MTKDNKNKVRFFYSLFFSFVIGISLFCLFFGVGLYIAYGNDKVLTNALTESKYYDGVNNEINLMIKNLAKERSIPEDVVSGVITSKKINIDSNNYITRVLAGRSGNVPTEELEKSMREKINSYFQDSNVTITDPLQESIDSMITESKVMYQNKIELKFIDYFKEYQKTLRRIILMIVLVSVVFISISSLMLMRMYRSKHRGIRFMVYGVLGSIYLSIMANLLFNPVKGMDITPKYYKEFIDLFIQKYRTQNYLLITIEIVILAVLFYTIRVLKKGKQ